MKQQIDSDSTIFKPPTTKCKNGDKVVPVIEYDPKHFGDYFLDRKGVLQKHHGIHWIVAGLFLVADMAGAGIVALPTATIRSQFYAGLGIMLCMGIMATIAGIMLGKSWMILLKHFPQYRTHCRKPYPEIANRAMGPTMQWLVSFFVNEMQFGTSIVFLLLASKNIQDAVHAFFKTHVSYCSIILVVAIILLPVTYLKSPQDFWLVVVVGMASTAVAVIFICTGTLIDFSACSQVREFPAFKVSNYMVALGTMMFVYGGASTFPTIQHDMKRPKDFTKSAWLGFGLVILFNLFIGVFGGLTYGNSVRESVINSIQTHWIQQAANVMIALHCLMTVTLYINPLNQEVEDWCGVPHEFGVKRVLIRTVVFAAAVLIAESVPNFGPVLDLIGGTAVTATSMVFPCLFYLYLSTWEKMQQERGQSCGSISSSSSSTESAKNEKATFSDVLRLSNARILIFCGLVIVISLVAGAMATLSALDSLANTRFVQPCWMEAFTAGSGHSIPEAEQITHTNCCGPSQNVSLFGDANLVCNTPDLTFY